MAEDFQEKTEEATGKKLADARKKGQVAKSQDFATGALLFVALLTMLFTGGFLWNRLCEVGVTILSSLDTQIGTVPEIDAWFDWMVTEIVIMTLPMMVTCAIAGTAAYLYQFGFLFSTEPLNPKWKNLNVFDPSRWKKFFDISALMKLFFGLAKLTVIGIVCYMLILRAVPRTSQLMKDTTGATFSFMVWEAFWLGITIALILLILGILEFVYQKWKFANDQKMTKQEVKDERKQTDGDPLLKSKVRSMMQAFAQGRMKQNVPHADVVIANPVHYAIALKYDAEEMAAPVCVAKGARRMALQIKDIANENDVPIVENRELARGLYPVIEPGHPVPPEFYHAVAEVLAYVYRLNEEMGQGQHIPVTTGGEA